MGQSVTLIVKFRGDGDPAARTKKIRELVGANVASVEPLFEGETEAALAALFEVRLRRADAAAGAVAALVGDDEIEYAHRPVARSPARDGEAT